MYVLCCDVLHNVCYTVQFSLHLFLVFLADFPFIISVSIGEMEDLQYFWHIKCSSWFGHITRMNKKRKPRQICEVKVEGRRPRGRPSCSSSSSSSNSSSNSNSSSFWVLRRSYHLRLLVSLSTVSV